MADMSRINIFFSTQNYPGVNYYVLPALPVGSVIIADLGDILGLLGYTSV
jgi:hypothetical protein